MTRSLSSLAIAGGAWLLLASGCNAALGIQEAELRPDSTSGGTGGGVVSYAGDNVCMADNTKCLTCATTACQGSGAQNPLNSCLADHGCRDAMIDYGACLGKQCAAADCFDKLDAASSSLLDDCIEPCVNDCAVAPIYTPCQVYCSCLAANCQDDVTTSPYTSQSECLTACGKLPPDVVTCRRTHCELAGLSGDPVHCDHAVGIGFCGVTDVPARDDGPAGCQKSLISFACRYGTDCCSGFCDSRSSCAPPQ
jgi:hypothetical protein